MRGNYSPQVGRIGDGLFHGGAVVRRRQSHGYGGVERRCVLKIKHIFERVGVLIAQCEVLAAAVVGVVARRGAGAQEALLDQGEN